MLTLLGTILEHARRTPERVFARVLDRKLEETALTYGALVTRARVLAGHLREAGVAADDVVVIIMRPGTDLLCSFVAPLFIGAIPSMFPWPTEKISREHYQESVSQLVEISGATAILVYPELFEELRSLTGHASRLRMILPVTADLGGEPVPIPEGELLRDLDRVSLLQHSSGSTGLQKGVALSSRALHNQLDTYGQVMKITPDDVIVSWLPLYHDMGLIASFMLPLVKGLPLVLMSPIDWVRNPGSLLTAIQRYRGTLCWLPNFAYNFLAQKLPNRIVEAADLSTMRAFVNCSEPVRAASHEMFHARFAPRGLRLEALTTCYAMAENTFAVTQSPVDTVPPVDVVERAAFAAGRATTASGSEGTMRLLSSGRAVEGVEIRIVASDGRDLPDREIGEIAIRSECMLSGYFHRPDLTEKAMRDGWYFTGDLGYRAAGELYVSGRVKDLIIVGGKNLYPQDLEHIADHVPGVHAGRTVAFGVTNVDLGTEDVVVIVEVDDPAQAAQVREQVRLKIANESDTVVRTVFCVDARWLIKTSSGKIARNACKTKFLEETGAQADA